MEGPRCRFAVSRSRELYLALRAVLCVLLRRRVERPFCVETTSWCVHRLVDGFRIGPATLVCHVMPFVDQALPSSSTRSVRRPLRGLIRMTSRHPGLVVHPTLKIQPLLRHLQVRDDFASAGRVES